MTKKLWILTGLVALATLLGACTETNLAESPEGVLSVQATWPIVRQGDQGQTVRTVQYLLSAQGQSTGVDGVFGSDTAQAVRNFQSSRGLGADGVVGTDTWNALVITVRQGDSGDAVRAVQSELAIGVDGVFGSDTAQAVRNFQQSSGLGADGVVGPDTWATLVGGSAGGGNPGGGDRASLARGLIDGNRVTLATSHSSGCGVGDGASASANLSSTRDGSAAGRSSYDCSSSLPAAPGGSVYLGTTLLSGMSGLAERYTYSVSEVAGGQHSGDSRHYAGVAVDVNRINGSAVNSSNAHYGAFMQTCRNLGATEVLGPGDAGHSSHIHCAWPR